MKTQWWRLLGFGMGAKAPRRGRSQKPRWSFGRTARFEQLENRSLLAVSLTLAGTQTISGGANFNVSDDSAQFQQEMSVDVNPANPLNVAGFSHSILGSPFTVNVDLFYTMDGGLTWNTTSIGDAQDGYTATFRFDPSIAFDGAGNLYVAYGVDDATTGRNLIVARSTDGGQTFDQFTSVDTGVLDKWHIATGLDASDPLRQRQAVYVAYTQFDTGRIEVAGSNDQGEHFTAPVPVSDTLHANLFADPAVGPNGELYVSWWDRTDSEIMIDADVNGLFDDPINYNDFGTDVTAVTLNNLLSGFPGLEVPAQPDRGITNAPVLDVDRSGGTFNGRLYLTYVDGFAGSVHPDYDVFLVTSDNHGATWTDMGTNPGNVEDSAGTDFNPWVDVDQTTGSVNIIYYTTDGDQAGPPEDQNDDVLVRIASSINGGSSFAYEDLSIATSNEEGGSGNDYLEYIGLAVHDGTVHGLWSSRVAGGGTDLESLWANASFNSVSNVLTVTGDDNFALTGTYNDQFTIKRSDLRSDYLEVWWYNPILAADVIQFAGLLASIGSIVVNSGLGNDIITIGTSLTMGVTVNGGAGNDTIYGGGGGDVINGQAGTDFLDGRGGNDSLSGGADGDTIRGGDGDDVIGGDDYGDFLYGDAGNDIISGGLGNDALEGGAGDDQLTGNTGNDTYRFGAGTLGSDTVTEAANTESDWLDFTSLGQAATVDLAITTSQNVASGVLSLTLTSNTGIENVRGSAFGDTISANTRSNIFDTAQGLTTSLDQVRKGWLQTVAMTHFYSDPKTTQRPVVLETTPSKAARKRSAHGR